MQKPFSFAIPINVKGLQMPSISAEMMYLMTTDVEQQGKDAILRQLSRLFEIDLEELLHPSMDQMPVVLMNYDPFEEDWEYIGERNNKVALEHNYQLAKSMQTGETDDETEDIMRQYGWSETKDLKADLDKMLQLMTAYPFFWRAIKYKDQDWLKPYFEQPEPQQSSEEKIVTAFWLDIQELTHFITKISQQKLLWFAKHY